MGNNKRFGLILAGLCAGAVNGLFGTGGGMVLIPLLSLLTPLRDTEIFGSSIAIILPICLVSIVSAAISGMLPWEASIPYLIGSTVGGLLAGFYGKKIPAKWLHRALGVLIIWGGIKYLC